MVIEGRRTIRNRYRRNNLKAVRFTVILFLLAIIVSILAFRLINNKNKDDIKAVSLENTSIANNQLVINENKVEDLYTSSELIYSSKNDDLPVNYYDIFISDIEKLRNGDPETVIKYFGNSDTFTPEIIADRVSATTINFISNTQLENGDSEINIHICTIDYQLMNKDYEDSKNSKLSEFGVDEFTDEQLKEASDYGKTVVAENVLNDKYRVCYNMPITIDNGEIVIKESLKQAITGGWYTGVGVELNPVEHIKF